jgi:hypothetical protein
MNATLTRVHTNFVAIACLVLAAACLVLPFQTFAQSDMNSEEDARSQGFIPVKVFLFNENEEISTTTETTAASLSYDFPKPHRLVIDYSSVGAISPDDAENPATLFIGCFVDGEPCVGTQANPANTPAGWVNVLSCNLGRCAAWDSDVSHVWYSPKLSEGKHTVEIKVAVGNPLVPFLGTGTAFNEVRTLVVTLLRKE